MKALRRNGIPGSQRGLAVNEVARAFPVRRILDVLDVWLDTRLGQIILPVCVTELHALNMLLQHKLKAINLSFNAAISLGTFSNEHCRVCGFPS